MKYGYCRISTPSQSIARQVRNIQAAHPDAKIITEVFTGTTLARPKWESLRRKLQAGDAVVFDSVSRMSRDAVDGFTLYRELYDKGVNLYFLKEPHIDTSVFKENLDRQIYALASTGNAATDELINAIREALNRYMMRIAEQQIRLAFEQAQKEVDDLRQRTREGMETARQNGKQIGAVNGKKLVTKKSVKAKELIAIGSRDFGGTLSDAEMIKICGVSRNTFYKYKRELSNKG